MSNEGFIADLERQLRVAQQELGKLPEHRTREQQYVADRIVKRIQAIDRAIRKVVQR